MNERDSQSLRQKRIRTRRGSLCALSVVLLAGACGGAEVEPPPAIEPATAERLAATSDSIADLLDAGDVCGAAGRADELLAQVIEAINSGAVPDRFHEPLSSKANELVNEINCPPPPETDDDDDDDEGKDKDKEKDKKNEGEELPAITIPPPPTETEDE
jgi:hypothetical protein